MENKQLPSGLKSKIEAEADKHAFVVPYDGSNKFYDEQKLKSFTAGAEYALSLQKELMVGFANFCAGHFDCHEFYDDKEWFWEGIWNGETGRFTTEQLYGFYIEHLNQTHGTTESIKK